MATTEENVLVFSRSLFEKLGVFQGFNPDVNRYLPAILDASNNHFMPRARAETNPDFKQIIPYVVITDGHSVLHYVRGKKAGEQRLVAKGSIGIGGHVNDEDHTLFAFGAQAFKEAVNREVCEEVSIEGAFEATPVGLINDDSTEVGRVHFGVVHLLLCTPDKVKRTSKSSPRSNSSRLRSCKKGASRWRRGRNFAWTTSRRCLNNRAGALTGKSATEINP